MQFASWQGLEESDVSSSVEEVFVQFPFMQVLHFVPTQFVVVEIELDSELLGVVLQSPLMQFWQTPFTQEVEVETDVAFFSNPLGTCSVAQLVHKRRKKSTPVDACIINFKHNAFQQLECLYWFCNDTLLRKPKLNDYLKNDLILFSNPFF